MTELVDLPITHSLSLAEHRTIDAPLPRLLALHCAIAHILALSGAGDYITEILQNIEEKTVRADGLAELDLLVTLGLGG